MINLFEYQSSIQYQSSISKYSQILSKLQVIQQTWTQNWKEIVDIILRLQKHFQKITSDIHDQLQVKASEGFFDEDQASRLTVILDNDLIDAQNYVFALVRNAERVTLKDEYLKSTTHQQEIISSSQQQITNPPVLNQQIEDVIIGHISKYVRNEELKEYYLNNRDDLKGMPPELIKIQNDFHGFDQDLSLYGVKTLFINMEEFEGRAALCNDGFIEDGIYKNGSLIYGTRLYYLGKENIIIEKGEGITRSVLGPNEYIAIADYQLLQNIFETLPKRSIITTSFKKSIGSCLLMCRNTVQHHISNYKFSIFHSVYYNTIAILILDKISGLNYIIQFLCQDFVGHSRQPLMAYHQQIQVFNHTYISQLNIGSVPVVEFFVGSNLGPARIFIYMYGHKHTTKVRGQ